MEFEWDEKKALLNLKKHGVDFVDAVTVLYDDQAITIYEDINGEQRYSTLGMDASARILVVVYTLRRKKIRIISARKATRRETRQYQG